MVSVIQLLMSIWAYGFIFVPTYIALLIFFDSMFDVEHRLYSILMQVGAIGSAGLIAYYVVGLTSGSSELGVQSYYGPFEY